LPQFDFSISSPPYWNVLNRSTKDFKIQRQKKDLDVNYSESTLDFGNISDYNVFLESICDVYRNMYKYMKINSYICVIVKNVKKDGNLYPLAWDMAIELGKLFTLKDEKIWIQDKIALSPYGYPSSWASNILHHYCLIFKKEK
jgi:DNA modification methylase